MSELHEAAKAGNISEIERLIGEGLSPNSANDYGMTPLHVAAWEGKDQAIRVLLTLGSDINAKRQMEPFWTPLQFAVENGEHEAAKVLIDSGADVNYTDTLGNSAMSTVADLFFYHTPSPEAIDTVLNLLDHGSHVTPRLRQLVEEALQGWVKNYPGKY